MCSKQTKKGKGRKEGRRKSRNDIYSTFWMMIIIIIIIIIPRHLRLLANPQFISLVFEKFCFLEILQSPALLPLRCCRKFSFIMVPSILSQSTPSNQGLDSGNSSSFSGTSTAARSTCCEDSFKARRSPSRLLSAGSIPRTVVVYDGCPQTGFPFSLEAPGRS